MAQEQGIASLDIFPKSPNMMLKLRRILNSFASGGRRGGVSAEHLGEGRTLREG